MSASPDVIEPQNVSDVAQGWKVMALARKDSGKGSSCARLISGDASSSGDECNTKVRKPYTITKQRERWTESEHQKFLEALKLYGRAWRRIEEYIGTKTAVQIRSHAQKFFSKLEREASTGSSAGKVQDIEIPPPRPKRKPSHPYPKKAGNGPLNLEDETKELSAVSASGCTEVLDEGFQSGSFNPYINRRVGASSDAAFRRNPFVPGHFFGPQGSMKLFGKTVVVPKNLKPAPHNDSSKKCLLNGKFPLPNTQTNKTDLQQTSGFYPFSKDRKVDEPLVSDTNGSCVVTNPSEGVGESLARNSSDSFPATYESGAVDSHDLSEGEDQQQEGMVEVRSVEHTFPLPQKEGGNLNVPFPHGVQHNQPAQHWMNSLFRYHSGLALPPMVGHGLTDGIPANPLTYWQFMQASAVNYAAYTAAVAAAAAAGWTGSITGHEESNEIPRANVNEGKVVSSLGNDLSNPTALPSTISSWWPLRGFMPSGYSSPMGAVHQGEQMGIAADAHLLECGKEDPALEHISSQGEHVTDLGTADEVEMSDLDEDGRKKHVEISPTANSGCMLRASCARQVPVSEGALPDSESHPDMDATIMPAKCSTQESDTERRVRIESPQSLYSSSDEFDGRVKKQREGSSSGSNTPISECEAPGMLESKKRGSHTLLEDNEDTCSDAFKQCHQLYGTTTMESPKGILKHSEKGRKHQQKDSRHGGSDDSKRLKSSAHDLELRKEVSEEGRKAFQALFTSKLLPQTFAAANMTEGRNACSRNELISRPTVFKKESDSTYAPVPSEKASGECINPDRPPQGEAIGDVNIYGKPLTSTTCANLDIGFGCGVTKEQHEGNSKSFAISSSSGFVPYKRPVCMGASIPEQPSSL